MKLSVIIPVFKGENTISALFNKIRESLNDKFDFEIIFIDDKSVDNSWERIDHLMKTYPDIVKGIRFKRNYGQHRAIMHGLDIASGDFLITLDEDMQHDPKYIPQMVSFMITNDLDVLYGDFLEFKKKGIRKLGSKIGRILAVILLPYLYKKYSPFRIIRKGTLKPDEIKQNVIFIDGLLGKATQRIGSYPIEHFENGRPSSCT